MAAGLLFPVLERSRHRIGEPVPAQLPLEK